MKNALWIVAATLMVASSASAQEAARGMPPPLPPRDVNAEIAALEARVAELEKWRREHRDHVDAVRRSELEALRSEIATRRTTARYPRYHRVHRTHRRAPALVAFEIRFNRGPAVRRDMRYAQVRSVRHRATQGPGPGRAGRPNHRVRVRQSR